MKNIYVFDLGNVITKPAKLKRMYDESLSLCDYETFKKIFYDSEEAKKVYKGEISDDEFFSKVKKQSGSKVEVRDLKRLYLENKGGIYQSTLDIIKELRNSGNFICLLSNLKEIDLQYLSSAIDMNLFDKKFLSFLMKMAKPDKEIFEKVINELGTNDFYFFDDSMKNITSANSLGIDAYNVTGDTIKDCFTKSLKRK